MLYRKLLVFGMAVFGGFVTTTLAQMTEVTVESDVVLKDVDRLGFNLGDDNYWAGSAFTKMRSLMNFEGVMYRQLTFGPQAPDGQGYLTWYPPAKGWEDIYTGARFTMVSGPAKGETGQIAQVEMREFDQRGRKIKLPYFKFAKPVKPGASINEGMLIERDLTHVGRFSKQTHYWNSDHLTLITDDIDPNTFGHAALLMDATAKPAFVRLPTHYQKHGDLQRKWKICFHAKAKAGNPVVKIKMVNVSASPTTVAVTDQWQRYEVEIDVTTQSQNPDNHMQMVLQIDSGKMAVDDIALIEMGHTNPTAFRDDLIATLQTLNPGSLRYLQMGGSTVENPIRPPLQSFAYQSMPDIVDDKGYGTRARFDKYSLHEFYELCEYVGSQPWYCLPGTLHPQEVAFFMDYLAGDESTDGGKLRHALGHPKPWTDVFDKIHVEFGNEAWNTARHYRMGGFNGPDYWQDLIGAGKSSSNYKTNVIFHAGSQAASARRSGMIAKNVPNADAVSIAPYILHTLNKKDLEAMKTEENFFKWALAYPIWRATDPQGTMYQQYQNVVANAGIDLSVYEINHHVTQGDAPLAIRNKLVDSIGGAANLLNTLMLHMKHQKIKTQCVFAACGNAKITAEKGAMHLWGTILSMRADQPRYRPTFLATQIANQVLAGDMIQTRHTQNQPAFSATGVFQNRQPASTLTYPVLHSYAFKNGNTYGMIVINLDLEKSHSIKVKTSASGSVAAKRWILAADQFAANNEFESGQPQVNILEDQVQVNEPYEMPPHSVMVMQWQE